MYKFISSMLVAVGVLAPTFFIPAPAPAVAEARIPTVVPEVVSGVMDAAEQAALVRELQDMVAGLQAAVSRAAKKTDAPAPRQTEPEQTTEIRTVPFYSQFNDITSPSWQGVGCGIASLAMLVDYYKPAVPADTLLANGIARNAFLPNAGWTHWGLIGIAQQYGLTGEPVSLAHLTVDDAFEELRNVVAEGPVMVSVHYTFEPTNPIPHLVVVTDITEDGVYYNDPAESTGGGRISREKFSRAWKERYISIRPAA